MILDISCGNRPRGDTNLDKPVFTREEKEQKELVKTKGNLVAAGENLSFRDNVFDIFLSEIIRVSWFKILVKCPHIFVHFNERTYHRSFLNRTWFIKALKKLCVKNYDLKVTYLPFFSPVDLFILHS